ncbi:hypothetical protein EV175_006875, partial [Coemansia sp. RSA 1933]
ATTTRRLCAIFRQNSSLHAASSTQSAWASRLHSRARRTTRTMPLVARQPPPSMNTSLAAAPQAIAEAH